MGVVDLDYLEALRGDRFWDLVDQIYDPLLEEIDRFTDSFLGYHILSRAHSQFMHEVGQIFEFLFADRAVRYCLPESLNLIEHYLV